ncbi:MAG TPA: bacteriohemerythrin [Rectinemataceae bacterium]|nr:bacteriohemerythrin [Rectinemataceae bacterium]
MKVASTRSKTGGIGILAVAALLIVILAALTIFPGFGRPLAGIGLVAALILAGLSFSQVRDPKGVASASGGKGAKRDAEVLALLRKSRDHQEELAGQVLGTIRLANQITELLSASMGAIDSFKNDFGEGTSSLKSITALADRFEAQVAQLTQVSQQSAAASEEMAASIERMSSESGARYEEIKDLASLSHDGQTEMLTTLDIIKKVVTSVDSLNGFIASINDIADRTSLLAMNAAIQAAHAGEAGRGFAVVAGEVRKLAASSAESAQAISSRLADLIKTIKRAEETSINSASIFATFEERVRHATDSFLEIRNGTGELALAGREIRELVASTKGASDKIKVASDEVGSEVRSLQGRFGHLRDEADRIVGELDRIHDSAGEINLNSLSTAQSDIEQLRLSASVLEASGLSEEEASSLATILKLQHLANVARIRAAIDGKVRADRSLVLDQDKCELGIWLAEKGVKEIKDAALLREFDEKHPLLHRVAGEAIAAVERGNKAEAERLSVQLAQLSEDVVDLIGRAFKARRPAFMSWNQSYVVNNATIDGQHRRLVDLINELADAMDEGKAREALGGVLAELVDYAATHFKDEEAIFTATSYPDAKAHHSQHVALTKQVLELREAFRSGSNVLSADTLSFLREWLNGHILGTDKGYMPYIKG